MLDLPVEQHTYRLALTVPDCPGGGVDWWPYRGEEEGRPANLGPVEARLTGISSRQFCIRNARNVLFVPSIEKKASKDRGSVPGVRTVVLLCA